MFVASSTSGSDVVEIADGSVLTTATGGVHDAQNMLRLANTVPSLLRTCLTGADGAGASGVIFAA
jgi:hypothetical protein